ncbi:MgtC/SapB family protein, partial [Escherichia coli]|nr:MgtC/SapB family protein [Escherichia coli]
LAGFLGWERESTGKAAGMRTHILVGVAAVLFTAIGEFMAVSFRQYGDHVRFDAAGLVGAIVSGISFLGAGMIFFKRNSGDIKGLT